MVFSQVCGLSHKVFKEREFHAGMQEGVKEGLEERFNRLSANPILVRLCRARIEQWQSQVARAY